MTDDPEQDDPAPDDTVPQEQPQTVTLLAVGGPRHGDEVVVSGDATSWVDLRSAQTYLMSNFPYIERNPVNPRSRLLMKGHMITVLVHESIWNDPEAARDWFNSLALTRLYRSHGRQVPAEEILARFARGQSPNGRAEQN